MFKNWYLKLLFPEKEKAKLLALVKKFAKPGARILDIGCGYGRYIKPLNAMGYDILGVEQNNEIVKENCKKGLSCINVEGFKKITANFDVLILSHIIEHFTPSELLPFLDFYLSKLETDGYVIIATPLYSSYFYDDFDHVKPYHPLGLQMVFGNNQAQVQYYSVNKLVLRDLWFRKSPLLSGLHRAKFLKSSMTRVWRVYDLLMSIIYKLSFGFIGKKDGWVGVFQKL